MRGSDVFIVQPTCIPVNDNLMELLIITDHFDHFHGIGAWALLGDNCQAGADALAEFVGAAHATGIWRDDNRVFEVEPTHVF